MKEQVKHLTSIRSRADVPKERTRAADSNKESLSFEDFPSIRKLPIAREKDLE